jgi:nitrogen PTS system EIIA component
MEIADFLAPGAVVAGLKLSDKAALLRELAERAAPSAGAKAEAILTALEAREGLGSTGVGRGIAIPHARIEGVKRLFGLFTKLQKPIDFAAIDEQPVDLVFLLLIPVAAGNEHVAALAAISRRLREGSVVKQLRAEKDATRLFALLTMPGEVGQPPKTR